MFRFGNSELPLNTFLVDLDSYLLSKTTRFAQWELLRWAKYHRLLIALVLDFFIFQFERKSMNINTKIFNKTAATFCVLVSAATYVHSAVTITFAQSGADVTVTSSGTFDPAVCVSTSIAISTGNYVSACYGEISMSNGSAYKICSQVSLSSSSSGLAFGQDNTFTADAQSGINF